jgi:hypothetical protein
MEEAKERADPIRITGTGRLGRAEFRVGRHRLTLLAAHRSAVAKAALAARAKASSASFSGAAGRAGAADALADQAARAAGCGILLSIDGDLAVAGVAPPGGWSVRLRGPGADLPALRLARGGLSTARSWSARSPWRAVAVVAGSCARAQEAAEEALQRGLAAPGWLERMGLAAVLVGAHGSVGAGGQVGSRGSLDAGGPGGGGRVFTTGLWERTAAA